MMISEVLDKAADLIEPPRKWTKSAFARDSQGNPCSPYGTEAVSFCVLGAIRQVAGPTTWLHGENFVADTLNELPSVFNDSRTQPEVVSALREIAALARAEGK